MSISFQKLNVVEVRDPRTIVQNERSYAVLKAGSQTTWKPWTSTSISSSSIQFSMPPPSGGVFVDSKQYLYLPARITFTGAPPVGQSIIQANRDAPRAWPISGSIDTLQATINNQSVSINLADIIHPLSHFNMGLHVKNGDFSVFPNYPDQSQQYSDLFDNIRSPLQSYGDGIDETVMQRGAFPYVVVQNPVQVTAFTVLTAVIDVAFCEPIYLPPFYAGCSNRSAFFNVNSLDMNITFVGNAAYRMWSHDDQGGTNIITSANINFGGTTGGPTSALFGGTMPQMLVQYITPQETQILSPNTAITYPFFDIQRYPTGLSPMTAGQVLQNVTSNNIQLSSIPRRMYIFVRDSNSSLYNTCAFTDTYLQIQNLTIQFMNKNGLLASATPYQLYLMSKKNHCTMSWTQWSGGPVYTSGVIPSGAPPLTLPSLSTIGSVLCVEFATDIGLESLDAPGKLSQIMVQVQLSIKNISSRTMTPTMYIVPVLEGTFTIPSLGRALINIGVITSQDILDAAQKPGINYKDVEMVEGGNIFSGIKDFFSNQVLPAIRSYVDNRGISKTLASIPHPYAQAASTIAHTLGYGDGDGGVLLGGEGVMSGGEHMTRDMMRRRLQNY
jgi:hypothetical protein